MSKRIFIYLAGGIKKDEAEQKQLWDQDARNAIAFKSMPREVIFLDPQIREDAIDQPLTVFGRDMFQISLCDVVIADCRERRGVGVGVELLAAKFYAKPLIVLAPQNSHYVKNELHYLGKTVTNFVHPFLLSLADAIVASYEEIVAQIDELLHHPETIKNISVLAETIMAYKEQQLPQDLPMLEALAKLSL